MAHTHQTHITRGVLVMRLIVPCAKNFTVAWIHTPIEQWLEQWVANFQVRVRIQIITRSVACVPCDFDPPSYVSYVINPG